MRIISWYHIFISIYPYSWGTPCRVLSNQAQQCIPDTLKPPDTNLPLLYEVLCHHQIPYTSHQHLEGKITHNYQIILHISHIPQEFYIRVFQFIPICTHISPSQGWSIPNFPHSRTSNNYYVTPYNKLGFLRWQMIVLPITSTSLFFQECNVFILRVKLGNTTLQGRPQ